MVTFLIIDLVGISVLNITKCFLLKVLLMLRFLGSTKIGFRTLRLKEVVEIDLLHLLASGVK